jgi:plastocyanin
MLRKHLLLAMSALLPSLSSVSAQSASASSVSAATSGSATSSSSSSKSTATPKVHRVDVGIGGFAYSPNTTYADVGDIVQFVFYPTNHSVIRAEYSGSDLCGPGGCNPCVPYEIIHGGEGGFHSGNMQVGSFPPKTSIAVWTQTLPVTNVQADFSVRVIPKLLISPSIRRIRSGFIAMLSSPAIQMAWLELSIQSAYNFPL